LAFAQAARLFRLALEVESAPVVRAELEEGLGRALSNAGHGVEAAEAYVRAAACCDGQHALELRLRAGEQLLRSGRVERGFSVLSDLAGVLDLRMPRYTGEYALAVLHATARIELNAVAKRTPKPMAADSAQQLRAHLCWTLAAGLSLVNTGMATYFLARSSEVALRSGDVERALRSMATLGAALYQVDATRVVGRRMLEHARALAAQVGSAENVAWIALDSGIAALADGDFVSCERSCSEAQAAFRDHCTGVAWEVVTSQAFTLWAMVYQGKLSSVAERMPGMVADARMRDDRFAVATLILGPLHLVGLARDEPDRVRAECDEAMRDWTGALCVFQRSCALFVQAQVELYERKPELAWQRLSAHWSELETSMILQVRLHRVEFLGLRARAAIGCAALDSPQREVWLSRAKAATELLRREKLHFARGLAESVDASRALLRDDRPRALSCLERACEAFAKQGMALHAGVARSGLAELRGDRAAAASEQRRVAELGVVNVASMQRLWLPGLLIG
jgi:hypothetical protein